MIRIVLKDKTAPSDKTFQNATKDIINIMIGTKFSDNDKNSKNPEIEIRPEYDLESEYFYNKQMKETSSNIIKVSSMFWKKFPQMIVFLKELASLDNFQQADE